MGQLSPLLPRLLLEGVVAGVGYLLEDGGRGGYLEAGGGGWYLEVVDHIGGNHLFLLVGGVVPLVLRWVCCK